MKYLLDTQMLIWAAALPESLPDRAMKLIGDPKNELFFSPASLWEVAIKSGLGKPSFQFDASLLRRGLLDNNYRELAITGLHAAGVGGLPDIHKDPFDRMLLAQAKADGLWLLTSDSVLKKYPAPVELAAP